MNRLPNIHPGDVLRLDFLEPLGISAYRLAKDIDVPQTRISQILNGRRAVTPDTAARLGRYLNTSPDVWLNLQRRYDLEELSLQKKAEYEKIVPFARSAEFTPA